MHAQIPTAFDFLFTPSRYKVAHGGRGGAKSWAFARALLIKAWEESKRVLCAREVQNSIQDSVHRILADQIQTLDMGAFFRVEKARIYGINGSEFGFAGLRHNIADIKSYEGADLCWVEEAANVSHNSWETLIPTIRKQGSEIWVSFNAMLESDATYKRFVINPPKNCIVRKVGHEDNPWFPDVLRDEMLDLKERDYDAYLNVWEGHCRVTLEGAIYADELRRATADGRITRVPFDETIPVQTFWDLGWADHNSIWFAQKVGFEYRLIDCYQSRLKKIQHYIQTLQERGYTYGAHWLPHDGDHETIGAESIRKTIARAFPNADVNVVPRVPNKILEYKAAREIFGSCVFDETKCADGLQALRHYTFEIDERGQWSEKAKHDENSHYADAFGCFARSINRKHEVKQAQEIIQVSYSRDQESAAWMG